MADYATPELRRKMLGYQESIHSGVQEMWKRFAGMFALGASILLVASACTTPESGDVGPQPTGAFVSTTTPAESSNNGSSASAQSDLTTVTVTLNEFSIEMSRTEFEAGVDYEFEVVNDGFVPHEMMVMVPIEPGTTMDMEELDEAAIAVFEADDLGPGATVAQTVVFPDSGAIVLEAACRLPGHYEAGMQIPITVTS